MAQLTRHRRLAASPRQVWEVLADFGELAAWVPSVSHTTLTTTSTEGPGTARRVQSGRTVLLETVVDWQPEATLAYRIDGLPKLVRHAENRWTLTPVAGGTDVAITSTVDTGARPPRKALAGVVVRVLGRVSGQLLDGLATRLADVPAEPSTDSAGAADSDPTATPPRGTDHG